MSQYDVVLHATDFSKDADQAFSVACAIARDHFATLVVVHVVPPETPLDCDSNSNILVGDQATVAPYRQQFERLRQIADGIPISFRLVKGYPIGTILNVAHEESADVIVIASEFNEGQAFQLHSGIAEGVLRQAHCPVCCFRLPTSQLSPNTRRAARCNTLLN